MHDHTDAPVRVWLAIGRQLAAAECVFSCQGLEHYNSTTTYTNIKAPGYRAVTGVVQGGDDQNGDHAHEQPVHVAANNFDKFVKMKQGDEYPKLTFDQFNAMNKAGDMEAIVPVYSYGSHRASWPLTEKYCETMLALHNPAIKEYKDVKGDHATYVDAMHAFLSSDDVSRCANLRKNLLLRLSYKYIIANVRLRL